jgi:hypothetical protein
MNVLLPTRDATPKTLDKRLKGLPHISPKPREDELFEFRILN